MATPSPSAEARSLDCKSTRKRSQVAIDRSCRTVFDRSGSHSSSSAHPRQKRGRAALLVAADFAELSGNEPESGFMRLAMARRAHGEMALGANVIGALERIAARDLINRQLPARVEDTIGGAQIFFRCAMTIEAPLHVERRDAPRQGHDVDRAVAGP